MLGQRTEDARKRMIVVVALNLSMPEVAGVSVSDDGVDEKVVDLREI